MAGQGSTSGELKPQRCFTPRGNTFPNIINLLFPILFWNLFCVRTWIFALVPTLPNADTAVFNLFHKKEKKKLCQLFISITSQMHPCFLGTSFLNARLLFSVVLKTGTQSKRKPKVVPIISQKPSVNAGYHLVALVGPGSCSECFLILYVTSYF